MRRPVYAIAIYPGYKDQPFSLTIHRLATEHDYPMRAKFISRASRLRLLRCLAGLPAFGDTDTLTINTTADEFLAGINLLVDPLKAKIALLREALALMPEWVQGKHDYAEYCPICGGNRDYGGHAQDCLRQRALEETK